jgi:DNA-binding FadR family transcriptional regulator
MAKHVKENRPRSVHAWVAYELGTRIVSGVYAPGEYIPNEAAIGQELSVSRTALREAFKILSAKGLLESRPKLGTRVRPRECWNMFDSDVLKWSFESEPSAEFLHSLFEVREVIEPSAAALAAKRATEEQVVVIEKAYQAMEEAEIGSEDVILADINFHMSILRATNNEFMISLGVSIKTALMELFRISSSQESEYVGSLPGHKAVYQGIRDRDPERARFEMKSLLSKSVRGALENLGKESPGMDVAV